MGSLLTLAVEGPKAIAPASGWFLENAWIIALLPAISFVLILFFGKRMPKKGSEIGIAAVAIAFVLAVLTAGQWINQVDTADERVPKEDKGEELGPVEFVGVAVHHVEGGLGTDLTRHRIGERRDEMLIQFDRHDLGTCLEEAGRERAHARPDLDHPIPRLHPGGSDDPLDGVGVDDEVLAQSARGLDAVTIEEFSHCGCAEHGARLPAAHRRGPQRPAVTADGGRHTWARDASRACCRARRPSCPGPPAQLAPGRHLRARGRRRGPLNPRCLG